MLPHLQLAHGDERAAVLADEVGAAQVHLQLRLEPGGVVALGALVHPHVEVDRVDVVSQLCWMDINIYEAKVVTYRSVYCIVPNQKNQPNLYLCIWFGNTKYAIFP